MGWNHQPYWGWGGNPSECYVGGSENWRDFYAPRSCFFFSGETHVSNKNEWNKCVQQKWQKKNPWRFNLERNGWSFGKSLLIHTFLIHIIHIHIYVYIYIINKLRKNDIIWCKFYPTNLKNLMKNSILPTTLMDSYTYTLIIQQLVSRPGRRLAWRSRGGGSALPSGGSVGSVGEAAQCPQKTYGVWGFVGKKNGGNDIFPYPKFVMW